MQSISTRAGYKGEDGPFTVHVRPESGEKILELVGYNGNSWVLNTQTVNSRQWYWVGEGSDHSKGAVYDGWNTAASDINGQSLYASGMYAIWVDCNANRLRDNYRASDGSEYTGKTTSFIESITLDASQKINGEISSKKSLQNSDISYESLLRNPDLYEGKEITITGRVIQALDISNEVKEKGLGNDGQTVIVVANYEDLVRGTASTNELYYLYAYDKPLEVRMITGDEVTLTFGSFELITYTQANGAAISVPGGIVISGIFH